MQFNTVWMNKEMQEQDFVNFQQEVILTERMCVPFSIACRENNGVYGIWVLINNIWLEVSAIDLVSSLYDDQNIKLFDGDEEYKVSITKNEYTYVWKIINVKKSYFAVFYYSFSDYFRQIKDCVNSLYKVVQNGYSIADRQIKLHHLEMCCKQLDVEALVPSAFGLKASNIEAEKFVFAPCSNYNKEEYQIGFGNRTYKTFLTDWDSDYEKIRHQFESLVYNYKTDIELNFDCLDTIIHIEQVSIVDTIEPVENGYRYNYKKYAKIKIIPCGYLWYPTIVSYCIYEEAIKTLYEGLLKFALNQSLAMKNSNEASLRMDMYNSFKSPILEYHIYKKQVAKKSPVKHIFQIDPDYDSLGVDLATDMNISIDEYGVIDIDVLNKEGQKIVIPELAKWQKEINSIVIASEVGHAYEKDWEDYHRRGLNLARQLREQLPDDCDLWYVAPFEDKSGTLVGRIFIL